MSPRLHAVDAPAFADRIVHGPDAGRDAIAITAVRARAVRSWDDVRSGDADRYDRLIEVGRLVEEETEIWTPMTLREIADEIAKLVADAGLRMLASDVRQTPASNAPDDEQHASVVEALMGVAMAVRAAREASDPKLFGRIGLLRRAEEYARRAVRRAIAGRAAGAAKEG